MSTITTGRRLDPDGEPIPGTGFELDPDGPAAERLRACTRPLASAPGMGTWGVLIAASAEDDGTRPLQLAFLAPGAEGPPMHVHPEGTETFEVLEGKLTLVFDDDVQTLGPGDEWTVEPGVEHTFRNDADGFTAIVAAFPSMIDLEAQYTIWGLDHEGELDDGRPGHMHATVMTEALRRSTRYTLAPLAVQKLFWTVLGPIARTLGHRAVEERYLRDDFWEGSVEQPDRERAESESEPDE
jgi:mannose-6-phosphate isomerase-like protein (cupin superfamily)